MITLIQGPRVVVPECVISIQVTVDEFSRLESLLWVQCFYFGILFLVVLKYAQILAYNALSSGLQVKFYQVTYKYSTEVFVLSSFQSTLFDYKEILPSCVQINKLLKIWSDWKASEFYAKWKKSNWAFWIPKDKYSSVLLWTQWGPILCIFKALICLWWS